MIFSFIFEQLSPTNECQKLIKINFINWLPKAIRRHSLLLKWTCIEYSIQYKFNWMSCLSYFWVLFFIKFLCFSKGKLFEKTWRNALIFEEKFIRKREEIFDKTPIVPIFYGKNILKIFHFFHFFDGKNENFFLFSWNWITHFC